MPQSRSNLDKDASYSAVDDDQHDSGDVDADGDDNDYSRCPRSPQAAFYKILLHL